VLVLSSSNVIGFKIPFLQWDCGELQDLFYGCPLIRELDLTEQIPSSAAARDEKDGT